MANKKYDDLLKQIVIEAVLEGHRLAAQVAIDYTKYPKQLFIAGLGL